jgi:hypothetical protein
MFSYRYIDRKIGKLICYFPVGFSLTGKFESSIVREPIFLENLCGPNWLAIKICHAQDLAKKKLPKLGQKYLPWIWHASCEALADFGTKLKGLPKSWLA